MLHRSTMPGQTVFSANQGFLQKLMRGHSTASPVVGRRRPQPMRTAVPSKRQATPGLPSNVPPPESLSGSRPAPRRRSPRCSLLQEDRVRLSIYPGNIHTPPAPIYALPRNFARATCPPNAAGSDGKSALSFPKLGGLALGGLASWWALAQAGHCLAARDEPMYGRLQHEARASPAVDAGEIGWRITALRAWRCTFANPRLTVYRIAQSPGHQVIEHVLGEAFAGTLISDGLSPYDAVRTKSRQLCTAHLRERCFFPPGGTEDAGSGALSPPRGLCPA